jgi:hypothetical protein
MPWDRLLGVSLRQLFVNVNDQTGRARLVPNRKNWPDIKGGEPRHFQSTLPARVLCRGRHQYSNIAGTSFVYECLVLLVSGDLRITIRDHRLLFLRTYRVLSRIWSTVASCIYEGNDLTVSYLQHIER